MPEILPVIDDQPLADFVHVARADREDDVTGVGDGAQGVFDHVEGRAEDGAVDLLRKIRRGDADGVLLARGKDFSEKNNVGPPELFDEIPEEGGGAGVGMRLETSTVRL